MQQLIDYFKSVGRNDVASSLERISNTGEADYIPLTKVERMLLPLHKKLSRSFQWSLSKEGAKYWSKVYISLSEINSQKDFMIVG